jgi:hypothetical protein
MNLGELAPVAHSIDKELTTAPKRVGSENTEVQVPDLPLKFPGDLVTVGGEANFKMGGDVVWEPHLCP